MKDLLDWISYELNFVIGCGRKHWLLIDISATGIGAAFSLLLEKHLWHSVPMILVLIFLVAADFVTGISVAAKYKKIETRRAIHGVYKLLAFMLVLSIATNIARYDKNFFFLPDAVFFPMVLIQFMSLVKNLSLLGLIPAAVANALWERIDAYKNVGVTPPKGKFLDEFISNNNEETTGAQTDSKDTINPQI